MENVLEKVGKVKRAKPVSVKMNKPVEVDHEEQRFITSDYLRNVHGHKIAMALFSK